MLSARLLEASKTLGLELKILLERFLGLCLGLNLSIIFLASSLEKFFVFWTALTFVYFFSFCLVFHSLQLHLQLQMKNQKKVNIDVQMNHLKKVVVHIAVDDLVKLEGIKNMNNIVVKNVEE